MAKKIILSRKAVLVQGGLHAYLGPRLAADAKLNLIPIVAPITDKNYVALKPKIVEAITLARPRTEDMEDSDVFATHARRVRAALRASWEART